MAFPASSHPVRLYALILGAHDLPAGHVSAARAVSPLATLINTPLPMRVRNMIEAQVGDPTSVIQRRANDLETIKSIDKKLQKYRQSWGNCLPESSAARNINLPLLHVLSRRFDYDDKDIVTDISNGMPIVGDMSTSPVLTHRGKAAAEPLEFWPKIIIPRNKLDIERVERFRSTELGEERWGKSTRAIAARWLPNPATLTDQLAEAANLAPRFAISEQPGDGPRKVRIIDDVKASGARAITALHDRSIPDSLDVLLSTAAYYRLLSPGCDILAAPTDYCHAYKNIGFPKIR